MQYLVAGPCSTMDTGYEEFQDNCYKKPVASESKNFTESESECVTLGGHLAPFHTEAEFQFLKNLST